MKKIILIIAIFLVAGNLFSKTIQENPKSGDLAFADSLRNSSSKDKIPLGKPLFSKFFPCEEFENLKEKTAHVNSYFKKYSELGLYETLFIDKDWESHHSKRELLYYFRINLNKLAELERELGLNPYGISLYPSGMLPYNEKYELDPLFSQIIISCTLTNADFFKNNPYSDAPIYSLTFKIDKWHKGDYLLKEIPNTFKMKTSMYKIIDKKKDQEWLEKKVFEYDPYFSQELSIGDKMLMMFRIDSDFEKDENFKIDSSRNIFEYLEFVRDFKIEGNKLFKDIYRDRSCGPGVIYRKRELEKKYDEYINYIEELERINDTKNFYKKEFKK